MTSVTLLTGLKTSPWDKDRVGGLAHHNNAPRTWFFVIANTEKVWFRVNYGGNLSSWRWIEI